MSRKYIGFWKVCVECIRIVICDILEIVSSLKGNPLKKYYKLWKGYAIIRFGAIISCDKGVEGCSTKTRLS